ncbi:response regulator [Siminovitchia acidinfaciens]|uniref:Response regulator n=1 Tax=Siminovitchia acidinfaciens TaxID=2321395 RepID=A0A429XWM2_9BACI|nr:response regulator [Siminovitchia acidinfaciens]RST72787.1 response regulator [Siminovitchia acidinfaciens]
MRYFIVDDDTASRRMLKKIINESGLGLVIGEAASGKESLSLVLSTQPDFVLIDLLMPELDGIETIERLRNEGFLGQFIMISQVVNKEMVGEAYEKGVEYFIHKPINRVEVTSILKKTAEQFRLKDSLIQIKQSLAHIVSNEKPYKQRDVKEIVISILNDMGIVGETGSDDIILMIEILMEENEHNGQLPPLKDLYEAVAQKFKDVDVKKESKAIEQRIRRTILTAVNNLASLGSIDYTNPEFEYYAPRYFDFQDMRNRMKQIQEGDQKPSKVKVNIRKFLQVLYLETMDKYYQN